MHSTISKVILTAVLPAIFFIKLKILPNLSPHDIPLSFNIEVQPFLKNKSSFSVLRFIVPSLFTVPDYIYMSV